MLHALLQIWGGTWFLLNKFGFSRAQRARRRKEFTRERWWRLRAWIWYAIGLPAWLIIFIQEKDWMVMGIEVGLIPAVILGIYNALQGKGQTPKWIKYAALAAAVAGTVFSHHYFQGIKNLDQALEISSLIGSLFGLFLAAEERPAGYLWFLLMNGGMAALVLHQGYGWLFLQQIASLYFVLDAYVQTRKEKSERASTANSA